MPLVLSESRKGKPVYKNVGQRRWECEWHELTPSAQKRRAADEGYEFDHDRDEVCCVSLHQTKDEAVTAGKAIVASGVTVYGCAIVQEFELEMVSGCGYAEWEGVGPVFEVDATGDVGEV